MPESKSSVLNIRLSRSVLAALTQRAADDQRPIRQLAALLIANGLDPKPLDDRSVLQAEARAKAAERRFIEMEALMTTASAEIKVFQTENAELRGDVVRLRRGLDLANKGVVRVHTTAHHPAGPVLSSAVPSVSGQVGWSGLKGSEKKGKGK